MGNKNILITGASGNIGIEIIRGLEELKSRNKIIAGVHDENKAKKVLDEFEGLEYRNLNFTDVSSFDKALKNIDIVFLLRPPQLAHVRKYFVPFTKKMNEKGVSKIVFLSVQGVENQKFIPHYKIKKLIVDEDFDFVFLRPGYFMQNLTTTLLHEIKAEDKIFVPSGELKFDWVDTRDIGLVGAHILNDFERYKNKPFEITGSEFTRFREVANIISEVTGKNIRHESPNLMKFFIVKRNQGISKPMIL